MNVYYRVIAHILVNIVPSRILIMHSARESINQYFCNNPFYCIVKLF